jgi:hypothetical protein
MYQISSERQEAGASAPTTLTVRLNPFVPAAPPLPRVRVVEERTSATGTLVRFYDRNQWRKTTVIRANGKIRNYEPAPH